MNNVYTLDKKTIICTKEEEYFLFRIKTGVQEVAFNK